MNIKKLHSSRGTMTEDWYIAQQQVPTRHKTLATATGYGTTHYNALIACMRDIAKINSL